MLPKNIIGKKYEIVAVNYLKEQGYKILETNYKNKLGEIDIICKDEDIVVFVEVKYRKNAKYGRPIEAITPYKLMKIRQTATLYLKIKRLLDANIRFDAIEILFDEIRHVKNIL